MLIVSDTCPLRYLIEVDAIDVLPRLYGDVLTTPKVMAELRQGKFPIRVQQWADLPMTWLKIESPTNIRFLESLDDGEASELSLAIERSAHVLLVDERKATRLAQSYGLITAGTLAVLRDAGLAGLLDFRDALHQLVTRTQFHHTRALIDRVLTDFESERLRGK